MNIIKHIILFLFFITLCLSSSYAQTVLNDAKILFQAGNYVQALPLFETEYIIKPSDPHINNWYGICLFETGGDLKKAEECLLVASKKKIPDSFLYLGQIYMEEYRFKEATNTFDTYESLLKKKEPEQISKLEELQKKLTRLHRIVSNTEDIQVIDSIVIERSLFLDAYKLSKSSGQLKYLGQLFKSEKGIDGTAYINERDTKIYFGKPDKDSGIYNLYYMNKLLDGYDLENQVSSNKFGLKGDLNYPYLLQDGLTIYFAAKDEETLGGYDLFVSRFNTNNDAYLTPERLNMPFNSPFNDYLMVIDEEKGIGWFASDRSQPLGKVCVYTFIPNRKVQKIDSEDELYIANRARLTSIKNTWMNGFDYSEFITLARKDIVKHQDKSEGIDFVIDDSHTYKSYDDFQNRQARETYFKAMQLKNELNNISDQLEKLYYVYSSASQDAKKNMTTGILETEKRLELLQKEISSFEIQARNQEIQIVN